MQVLQVEAGVVESEVVEPGIGAGAGAGTVGALPELDMLITFTVALIAC